MTRRLSLRSFLPLLLAAPLASPLTGLPLGSESRAQDFNTSSWTVGLVRFDEDGLDHTTANITYDDGPGLVVYCSHDTVIALRVDPFYPTGDTPDTDLRFVVKAGGTSLYDQKLGPFSFADNSYGGAIDKKLAEAMKVGETVQVADPTIGLDKTFPLRGSDQALGALTCV